ncbi:MAG: PAS domain-containing protein [Pseudorhizobium sp.]
MADTISTVHGDIPVASLPAGFGDRKELGTVAFERTRMPMVMTDARQQDNPIVLANTAFLDLTGYTADEVLGRNCRFLQGPSTSAAAVAEVRLGIAEEREVDVELLNYRKDGSVFWNQLHISPIRNDSGNVAYFFASQVDVTEFRKVQSLEASEHRLLMEVDHRAKNVLAIVDSLVRLSRADDVAQYASSIQQRVQALSHAHSLLSERGWKEVGLREVIQRQVERYTSWGEFEGPEIAVPASIVQPLSLVIHELAVNAAVHGALSTPGGRLCIEWEKTEHVGGFKMIWKEFGIRQPDNPKSGFGTVMVKTMIERQLSGRLRRDWLDGGLEIRLEVPGLGHSTIAAPTP